MVINGFVELCNKKRRENKNNWVVLMENVNGKIVEYKAYNTWVQILRIEGCEYKLSGPMDCKVRDFDKFLLESLNQYCV